MYTGFPGTLPLITRCWVVGLTSTPLNNEPLLGANPLPKLLISGKSARICLTGAIDLAFIVAIVLSLSALICSLLVIGLLGTTLAATGATGAGATGAATGAGADRTVALRVSCGTGGATGRVSGAVLLSVTATAGISLTSGVAIDSS